MLLSVVGWRLETQVLFVGFVDADRVHSPSGPQPGKGGGHVILLNYVFLPKINNKNRRFSQIVKVFSKCPPPRKNFLAKGLQPMLHFSFVVLSFVAARLRARGRVRDRALTFNYSALMHSGVALLRNLFYLLHYCFALALFYNKIKGNRRKWICPELMQLLVN